MKSPSKLFVGCLCASMAAGLGAAERTPPPPRPSSAHSEAFTDAERRAVLEWTLAQPDVKRAVAGHRTRVLRVWSDVVKVGADSRRRAVVLLRDYDAGTAREIAVDLPTGTIETRELRGIQPNAEEIEEAMAIARSDRILARLSADPKLELIGGFHSRSSHADDPCAHEVCLELAFMKPDYRGPERYVVVNLTRRRVAHHDFHARPGERSPSMSEVRAP
jgi:hypothetical protein